MIKIANKVLKMAFQTIDYCGYRLEVNSVLKGWRVSIFPPGARFALAESPSTLESCPKEAIIAEAKKIIDARIKSHFTRTHELDLGTDR
jgi:hypothetical protein